MGRARHLVVIVAALLVACTGGDPTPGDPTSTSSSPVASGPPVDDRDRIAIIVGPPSHVSPAEAAAYESAARILAESPPDDVAEVRVVRAETAAFTGDLVELFTDQGYDLVCIVGSGAAPLLVEAARVHGGTRMCGTDAAVEGGPGNVVAVAVDPVALTTVAAAAVRPAPPPVGLVVGPEVADLETVQDLLETLLPEPPASSPGAPPTTPAGTDEATTPPSTATPSRPSGASAVVGTSTEDRTAVAAVTELAGEEPSVVVLLTPQSDAAAATLARAGIRTVVVDDWVRAPGEGPVGGVLLAITVDRSAQLRAAVAAGRDLDSAQVQVLRLADGVLGVERGTGTGAAGAVQRAAQVIEEAAAG